MTVCRLLAETAPQPGTWNMAVDEVLLESAIDRGDCSLRWYCWSEATISLGYFQDRADVDGSPEIRSLPVVRRLTGGGAIVHHHEWTYSLALPATHPLARRPAELYEHVHGRIIDVLNRHGIAARIRGESDSPGTAEFLCFHRKDARDVVLEGHKIVGSAQRRRRGAILQHGSILLKTSEFTPQVSGIVELAALEEVRGQFLSDLMTDIAILLGNDLRRTPLSEAEFQRAGRLQRGRYQNPDRQKPRPARVK